MKTGTIVLLVILAIIIIAFIAFIIWSRRAQKKAEASEQEIKQSAQTTSMLVIDKKRMRLKDAGLPQFVIEQTPKYMRAAKLPIVKAKVGPQIHNFICDEKIFDLVPVKKEVKAVVNGLYILEVKGLRSSLEKQEKQGFFKKMKNKAIKYNEEQNKNKKKK
ncbi:MAG TPA: hypothetical protein GX705_04945 [Clostridiales bacterium]|nr:hypothetical protein [Clostridiales bacterium]